MSGHPDIWLTGVDGALAAEIGNYRLVVRTPEQAGGWARFLVLQRAGEQGSYALIGSGSEADVRHAMEAAVRTAHRLRSAPCMQAAG